MMGPSCSGSLQWITTLPCRMTMGANGILDTQGQKRRTVAAAKWLRTLEALKGAFTWDSMVLKDGEQQVLGLARAARRASEATRGKALSIAKDL